jgi:hypothetical protein
MQIPVAVAFAASQIAGFLWYKATGFSAQYTGGGDYTQYFGVPRDSNMPTLASFNGISVRLASSGATGLSAPTPAPTLGNAFFGDSIITGTTINLPKPGTYMNFEKAPVIIHANEGGVTEYIGASVLGSGASSVAPQFTIDFDVVPTELSAQIYG